LRNSIKIHQFSSSILNKETTESRMMDADYAQESANLVIHDLRQNANRSVASQLHFDLKQAVRLVK